MLLHWEGIRPPSQWLCRYLAYQNQSFELLVAVFLWTRVRIFTAAASSSDTASTARTRRLGFNMLHYYSIGEACESQGVLGPPCSPCKHVKSSKFWTFSAFSKTTEDSYLLKSSWVKQVQCCHMLCTSREESERRKHRNPSFWKSRHGLWEDEGIGNSLFWLTLWIQSFH